MSIDFQADQSECQDDFAETTDRSLTHADVSNLVLEHESVTPIAFRDAPAGTRIAAAMIDRLLPLPFLAAFFWPWAIAVIAYDLFRDAKGASVGKRLLGLKTICRSQDPAVDSAPCSAGRSVLRNLPWAAARVCYLSVALIPAGVALDVIAVLLVLLSPDRLNLGDRLGGTRIIRTDSERR